MENIEIFVNFCEAYGVPRTSLFQTVDLFEGRNMAQVLSCLQQLGSEVRCAAFIYHRFIRRLDFVRRHSGKPIATELSLCSLCLVRLVFRKRSYLEV